MSFHILLSICWSSSLVHFKNCPEYLTRETVQVFIHMMRFPLSSFIPSSFLVLLRYSFLIFLSSSHVWWYPLPIFSSILKFLLLWAFWFGNFIPSVICRFPLFIINMAHFSIPNSIPISWLYILTAGIRFSILSHFWLTVWCCSFTLGGWFFSYGL